MDEKGNMGSLIFRVFELDEVERKGISKEKDEEEKACILHIISDLI